MYSFDYLFLLFKLTARPFFSGRIGYNIIILIEMTYETSLTIKIFVVKYIYRLTDQEGIILPPY